MSQELTTPTLNDEQAAWLADTMARNRARFGGWSMEADAGGDPGADPADTGTDPANPAEPADTDPADPADENKVQRANREAARYRTELRETQQTVQTLQQQVEQSGAVLTALRAAFGLEGDGGNADDPAAQVTELTSRVESLASENATLAASLVVHDLAGANGGNPVALLDSKAFTTTLSGLDPEASDYREQVAAAIKDAVSKNVAYRAGLGSGRGGSELNPDDREQAKRARAKGLGAALSGHYKS